MAVLVGMPGKEMTVDPGHFMFHQRQFRGSLGATYPDKDFHMYLRLYEEGKFPLDKLVTKEYKLAEGILSCKKQVESNQDMVNKIKNKYRIKNTLGYSLNALIDYNHPLDIFAHFIIFSEGTLSFFSSV